LFLTQWSAITTALSVKVADKTAESLIDQALACNAIGGVHDRQTPTVFISLLLKLLQIQPEKEILFEYLLAEEFK
jgi:pre-mRNA-splicing factor 38A